MMQKSEVVKLFSILALAYPAFDRSSTSAATVALWHELLQDMPFATARIAVKKWIAQQPFPPTIADVRRECATLQPQKAALPDSAAAWEEVLRAIRRFGVYQATPAYASMSPLTAQIVRHMGWRNLNLADESSVSVLRGQFLKLYEQAAARQKAAALLPASIREALPQDTKAGDN